MSDKRILGFEDVRLDSIEAGSSVSNAAYVTPVKLAEWRIKQNAKSIYDLCQNAISPYSGARYDAVDADRAFALAKDLEFRHQEIIQEVYKDLNGNTLIPSDSRVPAGARTHTIRREESAGSMVWFRGNSSKRGNASVNVDEKEYKIQAAVTQYKINFFDEMAADFAGYQLEQKLRDACVRVSEEFRNHVVWHGDEDLGVPGMFNSPFGPKQVSPVAFGPGSAASAEAQVNELHRLFNRIHEDTDNKFGPVAVAMPIRMHNYLNNRILAAANGSNISMAELFLQKNTYITSLIPVREMSGAGPGGLDIMMGFRPGDRESAHAVIPQGLTWMPMERNGYDMVTDAFILLGGVNQYRPLNNQLVYFEYE
jgi:hypothetical protein